MKFAHLLFMGIIIFSPTVLMADNSEKDSAEITEQSVNDLPETGAGPVAGKKDDCE